MQLAETSPIKVDYKDSVVTLQRSGLKGTDTDLQFQGSMSTTNAAPMSLVLLGTVNLHLAQVFEPDIRSSGELKFNINSSGAANSPDLGGQIEIVDANFASGDLPVGLQHGNGVLTLTKDRLNIAKFQGAVGGGTLTAQGGVAYRPGIQFDLGLAAKGVRVLYPQGVRETVNANLRLAGTTDNALLGGQVNLADLSFTPAFDLTDFINQFSGGVSPPPTPGLAQNIQLNVGVNSENNINLVSRTLSMNGAANLRVRGTAAQPVILGRVNLSGGDIILNGDRFVLNGGTIEFVNPAETQPVVNLALNTTIQQYNISMRFNGPVDQLRTNYSSDPSFRRPTSSTYWHLDSTTEASANAPSAPANQAGGVVGGLAGEQPGDQQGLESRGHLSAFYQPGPGGRNQPGPSRRQHHHPAARHGKPLCDLLQQRSFDAKPNHPGPIPNLTQGSGERNPRSKRRLWLRYTHQEVLVAALTRTV